MSYDEHLISMAGGDGEADVLGAIGARVPDSAIEEAAKALEDAADELERLVRIGRTASRDLTADELDDYYAFEAAGSHENFLRIRAASLRNAS